MVALGSFSTALQAQDIRLGVRAGGSLGAWRGQAVENAERVIGLANLNLDNRPITTGPRIGFHAGVYASIPVGDRMEIEPGLFYSQKGSRLAGSVSSNQLSEFVNLRADVTNKLNYIDLPVYAKFYVKDGFHVFAGPQVSFLINNRMRTQMDVAGFSLLNRHWNVDPGYRSIDVAAAGGVGYRFTNGFNLMAGYDHGLVRLIDSENIRAFNRAVKVSVGYEF
jgi:hypothetical protein